MHVYDDCHYCGGRVSERQAIKACWWGDVLIALVDGVPAGVCEQCGERYYRAEVLIRIEEILKDREAFRSIPVALAEYAER